MPFALIEGMSKQNNINPGSYYDGDRNHQGEGIVQEDHKRKLKETEKQQGNEGADPLSVSRIVTFRCHSTIVFERTGNETECIPFVTVFYFLLRPSQ